MRFQRLRIWWHAAIKRKRVFYAEGRSAETIWWVFKSVPRKGSGEEWRRFMDVVREMPGTRTKLVLK